MNVRDPSTARSRFFERAMSAPALGWWGPLAVLAATRVFAWLVVLHEGSRQIALSHGSMEGLYVHTSTPAAPGYWDISRNWDGQCYELIATEGYQPNTLNATSSESDHTWAFPPLFPYS